MEADAPRNAGKFRGTSLRYLLYVTAACLLFSCKQQRWIEVDPAYSRYIDAYTTGTVSKTTPIRIRLAGTAATVHAVGEEVKEPLFECSPAVKGKTRWVDASTVEFKPDQPLQPGRLYTISFQLGKVTAVPEEKLKTFQFTLQTLAPSFVIRDNGLRSGTGKQQMQLTGELETADQESAEALEKLLNVKSGNRLLPVIWQHNEANRLHLFTVSGIERTSSPGKLLLEWDGSNMGMAVKGSREIEVPAAGDFKVLDVVAVNDEQQYASVRFSEPIAIGQDLTGLLSVSNLGDLVYSINGSEVKLYAGSRLDGSYSVQISNGIKNSWGDTLQQNFTANVHFENRLPSVKIHGRGNILPASGRLVLPFEAVNLNAVDVSILKIYEQNVPRFLQDNQLDGESYLRKVAKPVVQKTIRLDADASLDLHRKQRFMLDLDKLLKTEQGAVYRVTIGFRPQYSLYAAQDTAQLPGPEEAEGEDEAYYDDYGMGGVDEDDEFWNRYDTYYPYGYNWSRRDDPRSRSYYNKDRWATRNILASNIGLTAKRGTDNRVTVAVSNILTTDPMKGVQLEVLDFQQVVVGRGVSGSDGFADIAVKRKPWLLVAKSGKERGYLKLDDGNSLALSRFDVGGGEVKNGIKGFIFGERGVWRPGDSLFISCIIEDRDGKLPPDHPVEFSLYTPRQQLYRQAVQRGAPDGFFTFRTVTDATVPTGNWLARVKCGGAVFEKRLRIETVIPNRLKIKADFGRNPLLGTGGTGEGSLYAEWLFGLPGKNLKARVDMSLHARPTRFPQWEGFVFDNPAGSYSTRQKTLFDGTLSEEGKALVKLSPDITDAAPGMLTANLLVKVFEPGGAFSTDYFSLPYSPYRSYAGMRLPPAEGQVHYLLTGKTHSVQLASVDATGKPVSGNSQLEIQFYRIQWRWWWDESGDNLSNFTQDAYNKLIRTERVSVTNGSGQWRFSVPPGDWGRYLLLIKDLQSGHVTGSTFYADEPGWERRGGNGDPTAATMLSFTSSRAKYQVGEEVELNIPSSRGGRMLVSLESGSKVLRSFWQSTESGQTKVRFRAEPEMAPNIYATVSLLQPHAQTVNDLPVRLYGSIPVFVEDKNTRLSPVLKMPDVIRPDQRVFFTVSEKQGRAMTYSVALVDEGLLDLTRFNTPDPHASFYAREALGVKSFDVFDYVLGAWSGGLERILTIGGDAAGGPVKQKHANRFKPVVVFMGPFQLGKGKTATHQFTLPPYTGSVRAMLVAAHGGSYGNTDKNVVVKKPLMLLSTMPRVLAPGEQIRIPVSVFAMESGIRQVQLNLQPGNALEVIGSASQRLNFTEPGEQMAYFDVKVKSFTGIARLSFTASSGSERAAQETELEVRNPHPAITRVSSAELQAGRQWKTMVAPVGIPASSSAVLEISSVPPMNLQQRLDYLVQYPHGCIEQITSGVFPQLVLRQLTDLDDYRKAQIERNVKAGIQRLQLLQRPDGGFAYWPGMGQSDEWGSSYAGHFLLEAQAAGYWVNETLLQQWRSFQRSRATNWSRAGEGVYGSDLAQAYRLFTLALARSPELGAMNRLREVKNLAPEARWRLAAAYKIAGNASAAVELVRGLPARFDARPQPGITYGSALRDEAMVLETLTLLGMKEQAASLVQSVAGKLSQDSWYSTQTTAYALLAVARYCGTHPSGTKITASLKSGGKITELKSGSYYYQLAIPVRAGSQPVEVTNRGTNVLFVRTITQGQPLTGDSLPVIKDPSRLALAVSYIHKDGTPVDIARLKQGTDFLAKVVITNTGKRGRYTEMALHQVFPGGWEILNARMTGEGAWKSAEARYQDIRDDRVYTYFDIGQQQTLTYYVQLNAAYTGRYFMPGVYASAMYDNSLSAGTAGRWVEVIR